MEGRTFITGRLERIERLLSGWRFPVFVLSALVLYKLLLLALLLVPAAEHGLGAFAEEFRIWCFGYDPATGRLQTSSVLVMASEPLMLGAVVLAVWWQPLRDAVGGCPGSLWRPVAAAALLVALAGGTLVGLYTPARSAVDEPPFPADGLRTRLRSPRIDLVNQDGDRVRLADLKGRVVLLTASYASCGHTCPLILAQTKRVVGRLSPEEISDFRVLSVTLDPEHDTPEVLAALAGAHALQTPTYHLLTGPAADVNRALDALNVARSRNPDTGVIDHANLFILVDRKGEIAYRFTLGETQERWLGEAIRLLLGEG